MSKTGEPGNEKSIEIWQPKNGELVVHSHLIEVDEIKDAIRSTTYRPSKRATALASLALSGVLNPTNQDPVEVWAKVVATLADNPKHDDLLGEKDWV